MNKKNYSALRAFGLPVATLLFSMISSAQSTYEPYTFTTLAGGGGFGSPDRPGSAARLSGPTSLTVDTAGNVYVADTFNHAIRKVTPVGIVTTLAGLPGSYGSENGTGNTARFTFPSFAAVDSTGNVFVADQNNHTIRKVTPVGEVTTLAGLAGSEGSADGTSTEARFSFPAGVAVDTEGNVYVVDDGNSTIRKVTPTGVVKTLAGRAGIYGSANGTGTAARFNFPNGVAVDNTGNLYVADTDNQTIRQVTPVGTNWVVTTLAGNSSIRDQFGNPIGGYADGTNTVARFNRPRGVAVDGTGHVYVADEGNSAIRKLTLVGTNWVVTTLAGLARKPGNVDGIGDSARFDFPFGLAVDSAGTLYVADTSNDAIRKITPAGVVTTLAGLEGNFGSAEGIGIAARFAGPSSVAVDESGSVYVTDQVTHTIRKVTPAGDVMTLAGLAGQAGATNRTGGDARFNYPSGIAADNAGNLYVADSLNNQIRKIAAVGTNWVVTTLAGRSGSDDWADSGGSADGTGSAARFVFPKGVAVDGAGNLYVADTVNSTIRKVRPTGAVTTLAGTTGVWGSKDGTGTTAQFYWPAGLAVDSATNIYVADTFNHTIRKVTPSRVVTTLAGLARSSGSADGLGSDARFNTPSGIAVDSATNIYVADAYNNTIRKLTPVGTNWVVTTLGGMPGFYGTADGTGSTARFSNPGGLAVDSLGNLYVADFYFNTIRKGSPALSIASSGPTFGFQNGKFGFSINAAVGKSVVIDVSSDLKSWKSLSTNTVAPGVQFTDQDNQAQLTRFYRLRMP